ncbi:MAG: YceI family protein [Actinomycetia bacterium]|nr:YceI family protein [Actinomycetes bacterium]
MPKAEHPLTRTVDGANVPSVGRWNIDPSHTSAEFVGRHLMVTKVRGGFGAVTGTIDVSEDPRESSVAIVIETVSVSTGDDDRDGHIKSGDFFDVETYPEMRFVSTAVEPSGSSWKLTGDLTIKDATKPVAINFDFNGIVDDPWGNSKAAFSGTAEILREDWGLNWNVALDAGGVLVSKKIAIEIEVQAAPAS